MKNWTLALALGTAVVNTAIGLGVNPVSAAIWDVSFTIADPLGTEYFKGLFITEDTLTTVSGFTGYRVIDLVNGTQGTNPMGGNQAVYLLPVGEPFPPNRETLTNDNLFNTQNLTFSLGGIAYQELGGDEVYNLYYEGDYKGFPWKKKIPPSPPLIFVDQPPKFPIPARILTVTDFRATLVPEPTSTLSLLALGTLGAASTLKRQLKSSKSSEKETTKVS
ncbi:PEP-CTERM sorting domain-containing protein [Microcystis flos-aquae FACHB-1344]|uniref:PEP-CTERM sorting domain-containing protein n=1 Tax=Microcystis flos-aquae FACHB-1344 TaxID=2692899 RepID=A0ABR8HZ54_9CHRO|nr:PEP-CTERM sorting domain-containing protein [Microcystis flos-aquae]MBD2623839.1 PEP-CTERM sorting domain-containing protein [Microcystis flos-aquae FACHB-1344]